MNTSNIPAGRSVSSLDFFETERAFAADTSMSGAGALQVLRDQIDRIRALHAQDDQLDPQQLQKLAGVRATEAAALGQLQAELEALQAGIERGPRSYGWDTLAQAELERSMWTRAKRRTTPLAETEASFAERSIFAQVCAPSTTPVRARSRESITDVQRRIFQQVAGGNHGR